MKGVTIVVLALVAVGVSALPRPQNAELLEKIQAHLAMLPADIRAELETAIRNREKPSPAFFEKVREQMLTQLQENQRFREFVEQKYNQFLGLLTPELRGEVDGMVRDWIVNGGEPHASDDLKEKMKQHFEQLKQTHYESFLSKLSPGLREQVQAALGQAQHGRPHFDRELVDSIRQHFQRVPQPL